MKTFKLALFALALSALACAQSGAPSGNVATFNLCSTCSIRQFIPGMNYLPPQVQVWIYDPAVSDAYSVTLVYVGVADGVSHTVTQLVAGFGGTNTVWYAPFDAVSISSVRVLPLKFSGAAIATP
jgi:hypothetical protein